MKMHPTSQRAIAERMILTRRALGMTTTQMCKLLGSSSGGSLWSNYEVGRRVIPPKHMLILYDKKGITADWVYLGDPSRLPDDLRLIIKELMQPRRRRSDMKAS